jgi:hypothetical protein
VAALLLGDGSERNGWVFVKGKSVGKKTDLLVFQSK